MMEIEAPPMESLDVSKSFVLDGLNVTTRKFSSVKDKLRVRFLLGERSEPHMGDTSGIFHIILLLYIIVRTSGFV